MNQVAIDHHTTQKKDIDYIIYYVLHLVPLSVPAIAKQAVNFIALVTEPGYCKTWTLDWIGLDWTETTITYDALHCTQNAQYQV